MPVGRILTELRPTSTTSSRRWRRSTHDPDWGRTALREVLLRGNSGRARLPGKHGGRPTAYALVPVVLPDQPGELARLFAAAGEAGVNIEDVSIEHSPGQPVGLVELSVAPGRRAHARRGARERGWQLHS